MGLGRWGFGVWCCGVNGLRDGEDYILVFWRIGGMWSFFGMVCCSFFLNYCFSGWAALSLAALLDSFARRMHLSRSRFRKESLYDGSTWSRNFVRSPRARSLLLLEQPKHGFLDFHRFGLEVVIRF